MKKQPTIYHGTDFRRSVREKMKQKGMSAAKLSRMADLSSGTVYKYLQGRTEISAGNLAKLFDALDGKIITYQYVPPRTDAQIERVRQVVQEDYNRLQRYKNESEVWRAFNIRKNKKIK